MTDNQLGFVARFSNYLSNEHSDKQLINFHCIIHQKTLYAKSVTLNRIPKDVNRIILFIRGNALRHRQFREFLYSCELSDESIIYHSTVRWLSQGETSRRVLLLRNNRILHEKQRLSPKQELHAFLVDFLTHGNYLNQSLQGKEKTVCGMYRKVQDFRGKCRLLKSHLQRRNFFLFLQPLALIDNEEIQIDEIPIVLFFWRFRWRIAGIRRSFSRFYKNFKSNKTRCFSTSDVNRECTTKSSNETGRVEE